MFVNVNKYLFATLSLFRQIMIKACRLGKPQKRLYFKLLGHLGPPPPLELSGHFFDFFPNFFISFFFENSDTKFDSRRYLRAEIKSRGIYFAKYCGFWGMTDGKRKEVDNKVKLRHILKRIKRAPFWGFFNHEIPYRTKIFCLHISIMGH